jgi:hypothetical protein
MYARYAHRVGDLYFQCRGRALGLCDRGVAVRAAWLVPEVEHRLFRHVREARAHPELPLSDRPLEPLRQEVRRLEAGLGRLASAYVSDELLEEEYREARKAQIRRLSEAQESLRRAEARIESTVRSQAVSEMLRGLSGMGPEGWAVLSIQAKRDVMDVLLDSVTVYPKDEPRNRWAGPHRIRVSWR